MSNAAHLPTGPNGFASALYDVTASADAVIQTLRVSRALLMSGRQVCLGGLEQQTAQLCARCLGLDPSDGRTLRLQLLALRAELDATRAVLMARHENRL